MWKFCLIRVCGVVLGVYKMDVNLGILNSLAESLKILFKIKFQNVLNLNFWSKRFFKILLNLPNFHESLQEFLTNP